MDKGDILAVDDTPASLKLVTDLLRSEGYKVRSAINGELALSAAAARPPELVLLDINMPGMHGFEVCKLLKARADTHDVPVIFVSALSETEDKVTGFEAGGVDYVTKPYQREELLARVRTHLELYRLRHELERIVEERTAALRASEVKIRSNLFDSVAVLAAAAEMRDPYTAGHQRRVASIACAIAKKMSLAAAQIEGLRLAAVVHDIGKIKVPMELLTKVGKLSGDEFSTIKAHALAGYEILNGIDFLWPIAQIVVQHHERVNGSGYPHGLANGDILVESRILAVADVMDAIMSARPYRVGLGLEAALREISCNRGSLYGEAPVDACIELFTKDGWRPAP